MLILQEIRALCVQAHCSWRLRRLFERCSPIQSCILVKIALRGTGCLDEHLSLHEGAEPCLISFRFNSWKQLFICSQEFCLCELLGFFITVPELEEINDGQMVSLDFIGRGKSVSLESFQLGCRAHWTSPTSIDYSMFMHLGCDLELGFYTK